MLSEGGTRSSERSNTRSGRRGRRLAGWFRETAALATEKYCAARARRAGADGGRKCWAQLGVATRGPWRGDAAAMEPVTPRRPNPWRAVAHGPRSRTACLNTMDLHTGSLTNSSTHSSPWSPQGSYSCGRSRDFTTVATLETVHR